jgi:[protein-PII] uridylyltransferase
MNATEPVTRLRRELGALDRAYSEGHHGLWSAARRSDLFDAALRELFEAPGIPAGVALAAIGGYGRRQQLPRSDVDLLVLHEGDRLDEVAALVERLLYPLWDAGFEVGHAVRTAEECGVAARERLDGLTSMLDLRHLAGDRELADRSGASVRAIAAAHPDGFAEVLRADARARNERVGPAASMLQPDLKSGAGGLRDLQSLRWFEAVSGVPLEGAGLLRPRERTTLEDAEEFLTRVRSALHLETDKRADVLPLELQPPIARAMGFTDEPRLLAEDGLMRAVFEHARAVRWITGNVWDRMSAGVAPRPVPPIDGPAGVLEALADAAETDAPPSPALLDAIENVDLAAEVEWTEEVRGAFLRLLRRGAAGVAAFEALDRLGLLVRFLPAWADVRCRPQRDPYHRFTVDVHLTTAWSSMQRMLNAAGGDDPVEREMVKQVDDRDGALLGALLHDIGKTGEGGHVPIGARIAAETLERIGVEPSTRELASFMVREHLLLPDTATRRDLTDENLILDVAATVGTTERLAALYLLAKADAEATGPAAWTPWRQTLIRELVGRVQRVFDRGDMGTELAGRLTERVDRLRDLLVDEPDDVVERFVFRMPRAYFLAVEPAAAARHLATIAPDLGSGEVRTAAVATERPGSHELLVVAADRSGLLSWIAGSLALAGLSIQSAQAFTTEDGAAVDLFEVHGVFEEEISEARWRAFRGTLRKAVAGQMSLAHRVGEQRRRYPEPRSGLPVTVAVDNDASDFSTVIEVGAPDRPGLLYDITSVLADLQLDVHLAKVATYTGRVIDAFYVRDALGGKITSSEQIAEVESAMRGRLEG